MKLQKIITLALFAIILASNIGSLDAARRRVYYSEPNYDYSDNYVEVYNDSGSRAAKGMFGGAVSGAALGGIFGGGRGAGIGAGVGALFGGLSGGLSGRRERQVIYQDQRPSTGRIIQRNQPIEYVDASHDNYYYDDLD